MFRLMAMLAGAMLVWTHAFAGENWTAVHSSAFVAGGSVCVAESTTLTIDDGHGDTTARLQVHPEGMLILTNSNIDDASGDLAIVVDGGEPFGADGIEKEKNVRFTTDRERIIEQFIRGLHVDVRLRFWPTWPTTGVKHAGFSLKGFSKAWRELPDCGGREQ